MLEHAGATEDSVLRERDDLDREGSVVGGGGLAHGLDGADIDVRIDIHVRADGRRAVAHELREHPLGDLGARVAELASACAIVPDPALGAAFAAIGLPGEAEPRHVDVGVRVHEAGQREQAPPVDLAGAEGAI